MSCSIIHANWLVAWRRRFVAGAIRACEWLYGSYVWLLFCMLMLLYVPTILLLQQPSRTRSVARAGARLFFRLAGMRLATIGLGRLPASQHILLVNHTSFLDGLALLALLPARPGYAFVVRQQFRSQQLLCPLLHSLGVVVLTPWRAGSHTGNTARIALGLKYGENLIVFPEAGILTEPGLQRFHSGAFVAAAHIAIPLVLGGLRGTRQALRLYSWLPHRTAITLEIGASFLLRSHRPADIAAAVQAAQEAMVPLTGESVAGGSQLNGSAIRG